MEQLTPTQDDPVRHMELALRATNLAFRATKPEDSYVRAAIWQKRLGHEVIRWRRELLEEIRALIADNADEHREWFASCPYHVQHVYSAGFARPPQVPILVKLGRIIRFPGIDDICHDLSVGFKLFGEIAASPWWQSKPD